MLHILAAIWQPVRANAGGELRDASTSHNGWSTRTHCKQELPVKRVRSFRAPLHPEVGIVLVRAGQSASFAPA